MRAWLLATSVPWAITPEALSTILEIASREHLGLEAVEAERGRPLDYTHTVTVRDGVAVIPVDGPIVRRADMFTRVSGATSIDTLATDLRAALGDPSVRAILLSVDSPGGEINGVHEFAQMLHAARAEKPLGAYISHLGASAAYWLASACSEIAVDAAASVGSIGVLATVRDPHAGKATEVEIISSQSPHKRPDPTTERGRAQLQAHVDALAEVFVADVAAFREVSRKTVLDDFGAGGLLVGEAAVTAGLVDRVSSFEEELAALAARGREPRRVVAPAMRHKREAGNVAKKNVWRELGDWARGKALEEEGAVSSEDVVEQTGPRQSAAAGSGTGTTSAQAPARVQDPVSVVGATGPDPRIADLEARLAAAEARERESAARAFAAELVRAGRITPAQVAALVSVHTALATSGDATAAGALGEFFRLAPTSALLGGQRIDPNAAYTLLPGASAGTEGDAEEEARKKRAETAAWAEKNGYAKK